ncbi:MAG: matrixin family metalloprotease [Alphaproteobacteria bacterium]|nr:matrixin family metalloprotease [Alphaproteobacteria bacterium]
MLRRGLPCRLVSIAFCITTCLSACSDEDLLIDYADDDMPDSFVLSGGQWPTQSLTWCLDYTTADLDLTDVNAGLIHALDSWEAASGLTFSYTHPCSGSDLVFSFGTGEHGDGAPFDGPGGVLAHAWPVGSAYQGQTHFDDDEQWGTERRETGGQPIDLHSIALHELGHALGIGHSEDEEAVMYPYYRGSNRSLSADDVAAVQALYSQGDLTCEFVVQNPGPGDTYVVGNDYTVTWDSHSCDETVLIHLYESESHYATLGANEPNSGTLAFNPPPTFAESDDYQVCIAQSDGQHGTCGPRFGIAHSDGTASIDVQFPESDDRLSIGTEYFILWGSDGDVGSVLVHLYRAGEYLWTIAAETPDDGALSFTPPAELQYDVGSEYQVCVAATDGRAADCGGRFAIMGADPLAEVPLTLRYSPPVPVADTIALSGELLDSGGSSVWPWSDLAVVDDAEAIEWSATVPWASELRVSTEYSYAGATSWGCLYDGSGDPDDPANFFANGAMEAWVDHTEVEVELVQDPASDGCGFLVSAIR